MRHDAPTVLVLACALSGRPFMLEALKLGWNVVLLTNEALRHEPWPDGVSRYYVPDVTERCVVRDVVSFLGREIRFDRVAPMTDQDVTTAAMVREHLRLPGQSESAARLFRDKLAMRVAAQADGIPVPAFCHALNHAALRAFFSRVPGPYALKLRDGSASADVSRLESAEAAWAAIARLGDRASDYLVEAFVPGDVFHVDGIVHEGEVKLAIASRYGRPLLALKSTGGNFVSLNMERGTAGEQALQALHARVVTSLGLKSGVTHVEFIRAADGSFCFLEAAARIAAAKIPDMLWHATGVCMWHEWARLELGPDYTAPVPKPAYGGVLLTIAPQADCHLGEFDAPEVAWRSRKPHMPGLILTSADPARLEALMADYDRRFTERFARAPIRA